MIEHLRDFPELLLFFGFLLGVLVGVLSCGLFAIIRAAAAPEFLGGAFKVYLTKDSP